MIVGLIFLMENITFVLVVLLPEDQLLSLGSIAVLLILSMLKNKSP
jgi:hypothetical protein